MIRAGVSSLGLRGVRAIVAAVLLGLVAPLAARADDSAAPDFPVLFDARERLPRPDLSVLLRLRFLTTTDFPPFNFIDQTGHLAGFQVDLVREICAELGIEAKCQIQAMPFADLQAALANKQGDAVIAGTAVTGELRRSFAFSRPFAMLPARFVRNRSARLEAETIAALQGKSVGVVAATAHQAMLKAFFPDLRGVPFDNRSAMLDALKKGDIDAVFADGLQLSFWLASDASAQCCALLDGPFVSERFLGEGLTIMMRQEDQFLAEAFDSALAALSRKGRLKEISLRYFPLGLY